MGMRSMSRDESWIEYAIKMLLQVLINFSIGMIGAFFVFVFGLWGIVKSYQANPITAAIFFLGCTCAAFAFVASYLFAIFSAAAGGLYGFAKVVETNMRIQNGGDGRGRQHVGYHAHQH